jgi:3-hydroxyisobutyrate dehydrogenase-like beta-hydroxyacid dehydrogenase
MTHIPAYTPQIAVTGPGAIGATMAAETTRAGHEVLLCSRTECREITISDVVVPLLAAASNRW